MIRISLDVEEDWILTDDEQTKRYRELEDIIIKTMNTWKKGYRFKQNVYKSEMAL